MKEIFANRRTTLINFIINLIIGGVTIILGSLYDEINYVYFIFCSIIHLLNIWFLIAYKHKSIGTLLLKIYILMFQVWILVLLVFAFIDWPYPANLFVGGHIAGAPFIYEIYIIPNRRSNIKLADNNKTEKKSNNIITILTKFSVVNIDIDKRQLQFKMDTISIDSIVIVEFLNDTKLIAKVDMKDALEKNKLFDSVGFLSDTIIRKNDKEIRKYNIVFRTDSVSCPVVFIHASYENCIRIAETVFLVRKNIKKEEVLLADSLLLNKNE